RAPLAPPQHATARPPAALPAAQRRAVRRTMTATLPAMMKQPGLRQVAVVLADGAERGAADRLYFGVQLPDFRGTQFARGPCGMDFRLPENLVRHPVSNARKAALQQEDRLDPRAAMTPLQQFHCCPGELPGEDFGGPVAPPGRLGFTAMEQ